MASFDLQKSLSNLPGFPWAKYKGEFHVLPQYNYLGPGTQLSIRLDENMIPKPGEAPIDPTDKVALAHDIRYQLSNDDLDKKHEADRIMLEELAKIQPETFREKFSKWVAEQALTLKLKMGMKINPETGIPVHPFWRNTHAKMLVDLELLKAKKEYEDYMKNNMKPNASMYPTDYLEELSKSSESIKKILGSQIPDGDIVDTDKSDMDSNKYMTEFEDIYNKYMAEIAQDNKEYDDYRAEEERKAREFSFVDKLIEYIEKFMKFLTNNTLAKIPFLDSLTYDNIKATITDGSKSRWEWRDEAEDLDKLLALVDEKITSLQKAGHEYSKSPELKDLCDKFSELKQKRTKVKQVLGYSILQKHMKHKGLRNKLASELHSPIVRNFKRRSVFINGLDDTWSADLIFLDANKQVILTVIDCFSKYGWAVPIKSKQNKEILKAMKTIIESSNRKPKKLWTDKGTEFYGSEFQSYLLQNNIKLYSTESELKAVIVERFNRTLKEKMYRKITEMTEMTELRTTDWVTILPTIIDEYNNTTHSSHNMTPIEASKKENELTVKEKLNKKVTKYTSELPKFKIGDKVRIYSYKNTFDKGYKKNYTDEVFIISAVHNTVPWTYSISDSTGEEIKGKFYSMEMIHSDFDFDNKLQKNKLYNL